MSAELALVVALLWVIGTSLRAIMSAEVKGWIPVVTRALIRSAADRLPPNDRARYKEEWLAELEAWNDRPVSALVGSMSLRLRASKLSRVLSCAGQDRVPLWERALAVLLLLAIAPMLVAVAIAIRIDSDGPVVYRCAYLRGGGRIFLMLKFRTMVDSCDRTTADAPMRPRPIRWETADARVAARRPWELEPWLAAFTFRPKHLDDPRITRVGRFLRRTSIDEMPMLINVVRGDVSLPVPWRVPVA